MEESGQCSEEGDDFNDLISQMDELLARSHTVKKLKELEAIEIEANKVVMTMIKGMEQSKYKPEDVKEILYLHKLIVFRNGNNWRYLFSNHRKEG